MHFVKKRKCVLTAQITVHDIYTIYWFVVKCNSIKCVCAFATVTWSNKSFQIFMIIFEVEIIDRKHKREWANSAFKNIKISCQWVFLQPHVPIRMDWNFHLKQTRRTRVDRLFLKIQNDNTNLTDVLENRGNSNTTKIYFMTNARHIFYFI